MRTALTFLSKSTTLSILAGLALAASFPKINIAGLAWIGPGLLLFAASREPQSALRIGYIAGLVQWLVSLYWLCLIPFRWHGIPFAPATGWLLLSGYLALYPAVWAWLCTSLKKKQGSTWMGRALWALACAVIWVGLEMAMARLLSGFPWNFLGVSQQKMTPLIQIAAFTGVYGVSFLVAWFSASLFCCFALLIERPTSRAWLAEIVLPMTAIALVWFWGANRIAQPAELRGELKIALVQPSIQQEVIWDQTKIPERFERLMTLSRRALAEKVNLLVWPEAALPGLSPEQFGAITNMVAAEGAWMIFGADDAEKKTAAAGKGDFDPDDITFNFYNASFLFDPNGRYIATYRKLRLVIFGEYIPLSRWLPFLKLFTPIQGGFASGNGPVQFELKTAKHDSVKISTLICFEDVFPHFTRGYVRDDTDFLLNLTNDGWFGNSAAQWQHAMTALFRAVENGRPLIRCTNNGLTCRIDEFGRLREIFANASGDIYGPGFRIVELPLRETYAQTFYNRHGDWFGWSCLAISAVLLISQKLKGRARHSVRGA